MKNIDYSRLHSFLLSVHGGLPSLVSRDRAFPPAGVQIEVTHRCNLRCAMCFQQKNSAGRPELSTPEILRIIDQLPRWTLVTLTGGEPFARADFREILRHALHRNRCNILTNAQLLTGDDIRMFVEEGLMLLGISIDGIGATHDRIRGKEGAFEKALSVIGSVREEKKRRRKRFPLVDIKTVILKENVAELYALLETADRLGADYFTLSLPKLSDRQFNEPYYDDLTSGILSTLPGAPPHLDEREIGNLCEVIERLRRFSGGTKVRFYPYNMFSADAVRRYYRGELSPADFAPCRMPRSFFAVSPYGDVFPCFSFKAGDCRQSALKEIWNGARMRAARACLDRRHLDGFCMGCCYSVYRRR